MGPVPPASYQFVLQMSWLAGLGRAAARLPAVRCYCTTAMDEATFLRLCGETLEDIGDKFSELIEEQDRLAGGYSQL